MRWLLPLACVIANASVPDDLRPLSGVALLQKPGVYYTRVGLEDVEETVLARHDVSAPIPSSSAGEVASFTDISLDRHFSGDFTDQTAWRTLVVGEWSRWTQRRKHHRVHPHGVHSFLSSVVVFDWLLFACAVMIFWILHMTLLGRLSAKGWHLTVLGVWLAVGGVYNSVIGWRFGANAGINWFAGYLLEFIFLVENIFIFQIVLEAFKTPLKLATKALHIVVWGQIMFEMIFFMGLAAWLRSFKVLPYILGVWLICCGLLAARGEPSMEIDIMETRVCRALLACFGDRISTAYEKDGGCMFRDSAGRLRVSLLVLVIFALLLADFLLEIDVVLTKIEELPNPYIAFTSSAVAAFSIPDLFFVSKDLLKRFFLLKYGIGFVLVLFGTQMLLSSIYVIRPIVACCIIVGVLLICVIISCCINCIWGIPACGQAESTLGCASGSTASSALGEASSEILQKDAASQKAQAIPEKSEGGG